LLSACGISIPQAKTVTRKSGPAASQGSIAQGAVLALDQVHGAAEGGVALPVPARWRLRDSLLVYQQVDVVSHQAKGVQVTLLRLEGEGFHDDSGTFRRGKPVRTIKGLVKLAVDAGKVAM
jgi:hypothetical protein